MRPPPKRLPFPGRSSPQRTVNIASGLQAGSGERFNYALNLFGYALNLVVSTSTPVAICWWLLLRLLHDTDIRSSRGTMLSLPGRVR